MKQRTRTKILIVDDLQENLLAMEALLEQSDLDLLLARSGRQALELLLTNDVALALVDVQMPEMDGFELAELMRGAERTRNVPIIFVTAGMQDRYPVFKGYDAGAVDFLFKPVEPRILKHKVATFCQLYRQRQEVLDTLRLNEELMAVVGHDLRNPLGVILMTAATLATRNEDPSLVKAASRLQASGKRILRIIDDLFDLSKARLSGGIPVELAPMSLLSVAKKTIAELQLTHPQRTIELHAEGNPEGEWDGGRLEQVFSNLLGNALHHGTTTDAILVTLSGDESDAIISVKNGGAIPEEVLPHIFEPFHSGRERRKRGEGLGLGLYIVQQIVNAHGGIVQVRSSATEGTTTFTIKLPRRATRIGASLGSMPADFSAE